MTAPRTCRACGANLSPDVRWCLRCYEPVRELTPRPAPLPPLPPGTVIDPRTARPVFAPVKLERPVLSRTRGGPTSFGLLGRLAVTGVVLALGPWGLRGPLSVVYLLGYVPIAVVVLRSTWAATPVEPGRILVLPSARSRAAVRLGCALFGAAIGTAGWASGGSWLAAIPGLALLLIAALPSWHGVMAGIAEVRERPAAMVVALNALNVLDILATDAAIRAGQALELNPVVEATGPWVKLALVLACSLVLNRIRPTALVWPTMAFLVLAVYHLTGWLVMV